MHLPFQPHWLEQAIGDEREPAKIAQKIVDHPEFQKNIQEAVSFARRSSAEKSQTRFSAEHIVSMLYNSRGESGRSEGLL